MFSFMCVRYATTCMQECSTTWSLALWDTMRCNAFLRSSSGSSLLPPPPPLAAAALMGLPNAALCSGLGGFPASFGPASAADFFLPVLFLFDASEVMKQTVCVHGRVRVSADLCKPRGIFLCVYECLCVYIHRSRLSLAVALAMKEFTHQSCCRFRPKKRPQCRCSSFSGSKVCPEAQYRSQPCRPSLPQNARSSVVSHFRTE